MRRTTSPSKEPENPGKADATTVAQHELMTDYDVYLFREGKNCRLYDKLGAHQMEVDGVRGTHFAVWAPNATKVSLVGDFNSWKADSAPLFSHADESGIWEGFVPGLGNGSLYKYHIASKNEDYSVDKADPFAFFSEAPPRTASVVWDLAHSWTDQEWASARRRVNSLGSPFSVYECHLGSWRRVPEEHNRPLSYSETAELLPGYLKEMGYSHVEFLPVMEHPFYGSWGYQVAGFFAPTSRYGTPQDFMTLVDRLHAAGTGVILDWVPSHFPTDEYALGYFDGTHLYEYADPRKAFNPDWRSYIFDYGRNEVRSFLMSSAAFWLDRYHADGLRLDAVSSMLYLDYSRGPGDWTPNVHGGRENLEAISFLRSLNEIIYSEFPDRQMIAEESTAWPMVSRPTSAGGLGFGMKWNMGWMHDTLSYFSKDPAHRKYHQDELTFSLWYAFTENFMLPLSHDEVVHGKGSLLSKMPGDDWQKFANLRLLLGYMYGHPGKKLLFMGTDLGERAEWGHDRSLDWRLLGEAMHEGVHHWVRDLNRVYKTEPSLHDTDFEAKGFEWVDFADSDNSVISFLRRGTEDQSPILVVCNCTPVPRHDYAVGVPAQGEWAELLNSDAKEYGGGGLGNLSPVTTRSDRHHGRHQSVSLTLPPLGVLFLKPVSLPTEGAAQEHREANKA